MRNIALLAVTFALVPAAAQGASCLDPSCHAGILDAEVVHGAAQDGDCSICHASDDGEHPFRLEGERVGDLCAACHGDVAEEAGVVHGPVKDGACTLCHDPHASPNANLLRAAGNDLCEECHLLRPGGSPGRLFGTREVAAAWLDGIRKIALDEDGRGHPIRQHPTRGVPDPSRPGASLGCRTCHLPHGSDRRALLAGADSASLCGPCHSKSRPRPEPPVAPPPPERVPESDN